MGVYKAKKELAILAVLDLPWLDGKHMVDTVVLKSKGILVLLQ